MTQAGPVQWRTGAGWLPFVTRLDSIIYDTRLNLSMPRGLDRSVVILDIDEKSLGEIGHWPWNRALMAELVAKLFERYGVEVLGFDVVWAERDTSSGIDTLDALAQKDFRQVAGFQEIYKTLRPGSLRLAPPPEHRDNWRRDYEEMAEAMFYGERPRFDEILRVVGEFEQRFNRTAAA